MTKNPNLTLEFIEAHPKYNWDWETLSTHGIVTMEFIETHPSYPWNWSSMSYNRNLTMKFIERHNKVAWDKYWIFHNPFTEEKELFILKEARRYMAIYKIKVWWKKIYYSPHTRIGRERFIKKYDDLFTE